MSEWVDVCLDGGRVRNVGKLTRVTMIGVCLDVPLGDLHSLLTGDLVEGVLATAKELAGIAMAVQLLTYHCGLLPTDCGLLYSEGLTRGYGPEIPEGAQRSTRSGRNGTFR